MNVLVAAASRHGSTAEIAQAVGDVLAARGLRVTVLAAEQVDGLEGFDAVVLGSAVYAGHWLDPAKRVAEANRDALAGRPVWLFSSGPVGDPSRKMVQKMGTDPAEVSAVMTATHAREHRMFAGKLDRRTAGGLQRLALLLFRSLEGDFRDWDAIKGWAQGIADQLGA